MKAYQCESIIIHEDAIQEVQKHILNEDQLHAISTLFKAISDPTRIQILYALEKKELCVCDICVILSMTQSAISHQLKILRDTDLVRTRREGKSIFYRLADDHVHTIFRQAFHHVIERKIYEKKI